MGERKSPEKNYYLSSNIFSIQFITAIITFTNIIQIHAKFNLLRLNSSNDILRNRASKVHRLSPPNPFF